MNPTHVLNHPVLGAAATEHRDIIVVAASAGGVAALCQLCRQLPTSLPAAVFVVLHIGAHDSQLPEILRNSGVLPAVHPQDGETVSHGHIYVAPPNRHMLLDGRHIRLTHGPKEHHTRPAADPLFRSAALSHGPRTIGVVLTGHLDDGTAGMQAIKACGGVTVVQNPQDAEAPNMPTSVLENVSIDHCVHLGQLGATLVALTAQNLPLQQRAQPPRQLILEHQASLQEGQIMDSLTILGHPSTMVCPECTGTLWEINDSRPPRYRCHTGHAYSLLSLAYQQEAVVEASLWGAVRALQDRENLLRKMAELALNEGLPSQASHQTAEADKANEKARLLKQLVEQGLAQGDEDSRADHASATGSPTTAAEPAGAQDSSAAALR